MPSTDKNVHPRAFIVVFWKTALEINKTTMTKKTSTTDVLYNCSHVETNRKQYKIEKYANSTKTSRKQEKQISCYEI